MDARTDAVMRMCDDLFSFAAANPEITDPVGMYNAWAGSGRQAAYRLTPKDKAAEAYSMLREMTDWTDRDKEYVQEAINHIQNKKEQ